MSDINDWSGELKVYVVYSESGEYSDYRMVLHCAFAAEEHAVVAVNELNDAQAWKRRGQEFPSLDEEEYAHEPLDIIAGTKISEWVSTHLRAPK